MRQQTTTLQQFATNSTPSKRNDQIAILALATMAQICTINGRRWKNRTAVVLWTHHGWGTAALAVAQAAPMAAMAFGMRMR